LSSLFVYYANRFFVLIQAGWAISWANYAVRQPNNIPVMDEQLQYKMLQGMAVQSRTFWYFQKV